MPAERSQRRAERYGAHRGGLPEPGSPAYARLRRQWQEAIATGAMTLLPDGSGAWTDPELRDDTAGDEAAVTPPLDIRSQ